MYVAIQVRSTNHREIIDNLNHTCRKLVKQCNISEHLSKTLSDNQYKKKSNFKVVWYRNYVFFYDLGTQYFK